MKNPNSKWNRFKQHFNSRWSGEDYTGASPRFQVILLAKDIGIFLALPLLAVLLFSLCTGTHLAPKKKKEIGDENRDRYSQDGSKSQIIEFRGMGVAGAKKNTAIRSPGALVRVRLLNVVETYSTAPVHAQITDAGLGENMTGGTLIGEATPDTNFERITISFRYARDPSRENIAFPIVARALSLDGSFGLNATKKEGFFTRSVLDSSAATSQEAQGKMGSSSDFGQILLKALSAGLVQEFGAGSQVEKNRSQVLSLMPGTEFFAELTDFFPGGGK